MANADMCLEAARKAFPDNEELRVAYMIGFNEGFDRAMEQPEVDLEKEIDENGMGLFLQKEKEKILQTSPGTSRNEEQHT